MTVGLWFDWSGAGFGSTAYDDCTQYLRAIRYQRGGAPDITGASQAGTCTIVLRNPGGLFDPDNASGPLYGKLHDGVRVWFGANEDGTISGAGTVRGRFAGRTLDVSPLPVPGAGSSTPEVEITCEDAKGWYGRTPVSLSVAASTIDYIPPLPTPLTCSASVGSPVVATVDQRTPTGGTYTVTVAPSVRSIVLVSFAAYGANSPGDSSMALSGGSVTQLVTSTGSHVTTAHGWALASSSATYTGTYTPGFTSDGECAVAAALRTSAPSPVQTKTPAYPSATAPTFTSTPATGNIIVLQVGAESASDVTSYLYPATGWTLLGGAQATAGTGSPSVQVFARCMQLGDGSQYGVTGGTFARTVSISEWAVS